MISLAARRISLVHSVRLLQPLALAREQWLIALMIFIWAGRSAVFIPPHTCSGGDQRFDQIKVSSSRFFVAWTLQGTWV
ncbi:MAG: hypothetical protein CM15mP74_29230 [Halieaceae bacterium]|nr:MAG: hypothetical protein CM15mP74_29230 [Halieaceae bacterium]